jgi:alpha-D-ribose 1-methylphosphonate 5-triphosphate synthase subunit PhnH
MVSTGFVGTSMTSRLLKVAMCALALTLAGCVTKIQASSENNPPPLEPLSHFTQFQLQPLTASDQIKTDEAAAFAKIEEHLQEQIPALTAGWEKSDQNSRTLIIEPSLVDLKFVDGASRFFAGSFAGSSAVVMKLQLVDKETNQLIGDPEFFQRAAAMGGAWSVGGTDNGMLSRIVSISADYLRNNYTNAVGGPTGWTKPTD